MSTMNPTVVLCLTSPCFSLLYILYVVYNNIHILIRVYSEIFFLYYKTTFPLTCYKKNKFTMHFYGFKTRYKWSANSKNMFDLYNILSDVLFSKMCRSKFLSIFRPFPMVNVAFFTPWHRICLHSFKAARLLIHRDNNYSRSLQICINYKYCAKYAASNIDIAKL